MIFVQSAATWPECCPILPRASLDPCRWDAANLVQWFSLATDVSRSHTEYAFRRFGSASNFYESDAHSVVIFVQNAATWRESCPILPRTSLDRCRWDAANCLAWRSRFPWRPASHDRIPSVRLDVLDLLALFECDAYSVVIFSPINDGQASPPPRPAWARVQRAYVCKR